MVTKNKLKSQLCECGCDEYVKPGNRFITGHNNRKYPIPKSQLCKCGCGDYTEPGNDFIFGHQNRGRNHSDKTREKQRNSANKRFEDPLEREKTRERSTKQWEDPLAREQARNRTVKRFEDPKEREKIREKLLKYFETPIARKKNRIAINKYWEDHPEKRDEFIRRTIEQWQDPVLRKRLIEADNKYWENPIAHEKASASQQGQSYPDEWTGFSPPNRPHLIDINQCIHLNSRFEGCNQHHIMSGVIINIPVDLHKSVWHRMTNGDREDKNMKEINKLVFKYLLGSL